MIQRDHDDLRASCCVRCLKALFSRFGRNDGRAQYAASPPQEKPVHYCVRNALGTAIVKPIDLTKDETELAYNQQILSIVQTRLYRLRCQCKKLGKLLRHHAVDKQATNAVRSSSGNSSINCSMMSQIVRSAI
jgi:hypothetical protein